MTRSNFRGRCAHGIMVCMERRAFMIAFVVTAALAAGLLSGCARPDGFEGRCLQIPPRPAAVIMEYTGLSEVTGSEPPTFNVVGTADRIASWRTMSSRIERIKANGTPAQNEVFEGLSHGFGLGTGTAAEGWIERAVRFWQEAMGE